MAFGMTGYWNIYGCTNISEHKFNVTFSIGNDCDQNDKPICPVCGSEKHVEFIETDFLER